MLYLTGNTCKIKNFKINHKPHISLQKAWWVWWRPQEKHLRCCCPPRAVHGQQQVSRWCRTTSVPSCEFIRQWPKACFWQPGLYSGSALDDRGTSKYWLPLRHNNEHREQGVWKWAKSCTTTPWSDGDGKWQVCPIEPWQCQTTGQLYQVGREDPSQQHSLSWISVRRVHQTHSAQT